MPPVIHVNLALLVAVIASFFFGWLWYGPLFGKKWASLMGMPADHRPDPKVMMRGMGLSLLGTFLTAYVMVHTGEIWRPSVWSVGKDAPSYVFGFFNGFSFGSASTCRCCSVRSPGKAGAGACSRSTPRTTS